MRLIKPSFEILEQGTGLEGIYEQIELAGRTCYKSKRPEGQTAKSFVDRMEDLHHNSVLEHGTVYLKIPASFLVGDDKDKGVTMGVLRDFARKYYENPYSKFKFSEGAEFAYVTTNYRVLVENVWLSDLQYLCEPTEYHEKRYSVRFICDRGVSHELVRHRAMSFAQESQRYCNYSRGRYGNEITYIEPFWFSNSGPEQQGLFINNCLRCEQLYLQLLNSGQTPQQARGVLPNATKTEVVVTGFASDWNHLFQLRSSIAKTGQPHPDMVALIDPLRDEFISRNYYKI